MQSMFNNIDRAREVLRGKVVNTPMLNLNEDDIQVILPDNSEVSIKPVSYTHLTLPTNREV